MEVVSTSNLVSSETKKITIAFDSYFHNDKTLKKRRKKYISKTAESKPTRNGKNLIFFENASSFAKELVKFYVGLF